MEIKSQGGIFISIRKCMYLYSIGGGSQITFN